MIIFILIILILRNFKCIKLKYLSIKIDQKFQIGIDTSLTQFCKSCQPDSLNKQLIY